MSLGFDDVLSGAITAAAIGAAGAGMPLALGLGALTVAQGALAPDPELPSIPNAPMDAPKDAEVKLGSSKSTPMAGELNGAVEATKVSNPTTPAQGTTGLRI